jgi:hypothetical protein
MTLCVVVVVVVVVESHWMTRWTGGGGGGGGGVDACGVDAGDALPVAAVGCHRLSTSLQNFL